MVTIVDQLVTLAYLAPLWPLRWIEPPSPIPIFSPLWHLRPFNHWSICHSHHIWFKSALLGLFEGRLPLLHLNTMLFLLEPSLTSLIHTLIESFWLPHTGRFGWSHHIVVLWLCRRHLLPLKILLLILLLLDAQLMSLEHELFEFLVRCALVRVEVALVAFLLALLGQVSWHVRLGSWLVFTELIVRSIRVCLFKLGADLSE